MLNAIFIFAIALSVLISAWNGSTEQVNRAWMEAAEAAVKLALYLVGFMALWLGLMRVLRDAGALAAIGRALSPVMRRLFPDVPAEHPAMSAMIMNISANMLGLANAATPFGLKAMRELETLNPRPGVATNSMALFLAMNTSGVAVLPLGVVATRAAYESANPGSIVLPSLLATMCSTVVAVVVARRLQRRAAYDPERFETSGDGAAEATLADGVKGISEAEEAAAIRPQRDPRRAVWLWIYSSLLLAMAGATLAGLGLTLNAFQLVLGQWLLPALMAWIVLFGWSRRVKVYDAVVTGAREGFDIAIMIIPFLVAILVAVAMFRASGAMDIMVWLLSPLTGVLGFPAEALPMALIRPLSGSGAFGVMSSLIQTHGPDSFIGYLVSVLNGSTETTFYVLALYFGSVRVRAARHTVWACLAADATGVVAALFWCRVFF